MQVVVWKIKVCRVTRQTAVFLLFCDGVGVDVAVFLEINRTGPKGLLLDGTLALDVAQRSGGVYSNPVPLSPLNTNRHLCIVLILLCSSWQDPTSPPFLCRIHLVLNRYICTFV